MGRKPEILKTCRSDGAPEFQIFRFSGFRISVTDDGGENLPIWRGSRFSGFRFSDFQVFSLRRKNRPQHRVLQHIILTPTLAPQGLRWTETGIWAMIGELMTGLAGDVVKFWNSENLKICHAPGFQSKHPPIIMANQVLLPREAMGNY